MTCVCLSVPGKTLLLLTVQLVKYVSLVEMTRGYMSWTSGYSSNLRACVHFYNNNSLLQHEAGFAYSRMTM